MVGWIKLHNERLYVVYFSPSVIRIIKSRRIWWAGYLARMGRRGTRVGYGRKARGKETTRETKT
jgi:hypothetical protein